MIEGLKLNFDGKLTLDGLLTFLGGVLAFYVIWRQTKHSDKGLSEQLQAERTAREEEREKRKRAVAKAMLFEVQGFYKQHIQPLLLFSEAKVAAGTYPEVSPVGPMPFPIYSSNAYLLGEFEPSSLGPIICFYERGGAFVALVGSYVRLLHERPFAQSQIQIQAALESQWSRLTAQLPDLATTARDAAKHLSRDALVPFDSGAML